MKKIRWNNHFRAAQEAEHLLFHFTRFNLFMTTLFTILSPISPIASVAIFASQLFFETVIYGLLLYLARNEKAMPYVSQRAAHIIFSTISYFCIAATLIGIISSTTSLILLGPYFMLTNFVARSIKAGLDCLCISVYYRTQRKGKKPSEEVRSYISFLMMAGVTAALGVFLFAPGVQVIAGYALLGAIVAASVTRLFFHIRSQGNAIKKAQVQPEPENSEVVNEYLLQEKPSFLLSPSALGRTKKIETTDAPQYESHPSNELTCKPL